MIRSSLLVFKSRSKSAIMRGTQTGVGGGASPTKPLPPPQFLTQPIVTNKMLVYGFFVGVISGIAGSLAGMGGAFMAVPFLVGPAFKLSQHHSNGTTMAVALSTSIGSCLAYSQKIIHQSKEEGEGEEEGNNTMNLAEENKEPVNTNNASEQSSSHIHYPTAIGVALGGGIFSFLGAFVSKGTPAKTLAILRGVMMITLAPTIIARSSLKDWKTDRKAAAAVAEEKIGGSINTSPAVVLSSSLSVLERFFSQSIRFPGLEEKVSFIHLFENFCIGALSGFQAGLFGAGGGGT